MSCFWQSKGAIYKKRATQRLLVTQAAATTATYESKEQNRYCYLRIATSKCVLLRQAEQLLDNPAKRFCSLLIEVARYRHKRIASRFWRSKTQLLTHKRLFASGWSGSFYNYNYLLIARHNC